DFPPPPRAQDARLQPAARESQRVTDPRPPRRPEAPSSIVPAASDIVSALMDEAARAAASGRRALARQRYESALYLLRQPAEGLVASAILRRVGRTYLDDGEFGAALECLAAALAVAEAWNDPTEIAHTINVMAISHWQRGQLEEGERLYHEAGRMARIAGDERLVAMVEQNLGVVASMRGDVERALAHYTDSLARYRALRLLDEVARLLNNMGMAYSILERWDEAESTYAESHMLARESGDIWTRLMVDVNRAALLIARRDFGNAREVCERLIKEAGDVHETRLLAETYKH